MRVTTPMFRQILVLLPILALINTSAEASPQEAPTPVRWSELSPEIGGKRISIVLASQVQLEGTVLEVGPNALVMNTVLTSDRLSYPPGRTEVGRDLISIIEVREEVRGWIKPVLASAAGAAAAFAYFPHSISDSRINVSDTRRVAELGVITAGAAVGGYFLGKKISSGFRSIRVTNASASADAGKLSYNAGNERGRR